MNMAFAAQIKKVMEFLTGEPAVSYMPAPGDIRLPTDLALVVIDVQKEFCDPAGARGNAETREVSERIKRLVPEFRKAGIPTYVVYFSKKAKHPWRIDFYKFKPDKGDVLIPKSDDSAFRGSNIRKVLERDNRKTLLACGFNLNACVRRTLLDAVAQGFDVHLLRDLTGNDNNNDGCNAESYVEEMMRSGVHISRSDVELGKIARRSAVNSP
jgi:nicotinamidase-related amidase